jgi:aminocarboxymuconate-semialdehyde decarboxylase
VSNVRAGSWRCQSRPGQAHSPANLRFLVTEFGAERVAMGSDYPFDMGSPDPVAAVGEAGLDPSARALVEGGTAARFLGL